MSSGSRKPSLCASLPAMARMALASLSLSRMLGRSPYTPRNTTGQLWFNFLPYLQVDGPVNDNLPARQQTWEELPHPTPPNVPPQSPSCQTTWGCGTWCTSHHTCPRRSSRPGRDRNTPGRLPYPERQTLVNKEENAII